METGLPALLRQPSTRVNFAATPPLHHSWRWPSSQRDPSRPHVTAPRRLTHRCVGGEETAHVHAHERVLVDVLGQGGNELVPPLHAAGAPEGQEENSWDDDGSRSLHSRETGSAPRIYVKIPCEAVFGGDARVCKTHRARHHKRVDFNTAMCPAADCRLSEHFGTLLLLHRRCTLRSTSRCVSTFRACRCTHS